MPPAGLVAALSSCVLAADCAAVAGASPFEALVLAEGSCVAQGGGAAAEDAAVGPEGGEDVVPMRCAWPWGGRWG